MSVQTDQTQAEKKKVLNSFTLLFFKGYGAIYVALVVSFVISALGSGAKVMPEQWLAKAFPGATAEMNQQQLQEKMNTAAAGMRIKGNYNFKASGGADVAITSGEYINNLVAIEMAQSILNKKFPYAGTEMKIYKKGWFWNIGWGGVFTVYNLLGLFCALYLLLKAPVASMLDDAAKSTAQSLEDAKDAKNFSAELKARSEKMEQELAAEKERLAQTLREEEEAERERIMGLARHEAEGIVASVKVSVEAEVAAAADRLRRRVSSEALLKAADILTSDTTGNDHESAVNAFVDDLKQGEK